MKTKVYFRADGNSEIGLGHVMRCLALADIIGDSFRNIFLIQNTSPELKETILTFCDEVINLPRTNNFDSELEYLTLNFLKEGDIVVLDGYHFNEEYQKRIISTGAKLIFIDDIYTFHFFAHAIINHAGNVPKSNYSAEWYSKLFMGPSYAILRKSFLLEATRGSESKNTDSVFINMGGVDVYNHTLKVLNQCLEVNSIRKISIVIGSAYLHVEELDRIVKSIHQKEVVVNKNISGDKMVELMKSCGVAICSPSTISYEYCCMHGLLLLLMTADNQKNIYNYLIHERLAFPFEEFKNVMVDETKIAQSIKKQKEIFNGSSIDNLKAIFDKLTLENRINLRKAEEKDLMLYYDWANDPIVRNNSINKEPILLESHKKWYLSKIKDSNSYLYLFELDGDPIGQVRFDFKEGKYLIGFSLDNKYRNKGLGELILKKAIMQLNKVNKKIVLIAQVQLDNKASEGIFKNLGFTHYDKEVLNGFDFNLFNLSI